MHDAELQRMLGDLAYNPQEDGFQPGSVVGSVQHLYGALDYTTPRQSVASRLNVPNTHDLDGEDLDAYLNAVLNDDVRFLSSQSRGAVRPLFSQFIL